MWKVSEVNVWNRFAALEDGNCNWNMYRAGQNIRMFQLRQKRLSYYEMKQHKTRSASECYGRSKETTRIAVVTGSEPI